jgi:hypothetical protein
MKNKNHEWNTIRSIKQKIQDNNLIITQADKGKTIVILQKYEYEQHIYNFIHNNAFPQITQNPTNPYQRTVKHIVNQCTYSTSREQKQKHNNHS